MIKGCGASSYYTTSAISYYNPQSGLVVYQTQLRAVCGYCMLKTTAHNDNGNFYNTYENACDPAYRAFKPGPCPDCIKIIPLGTIANYQIIFTDAEGVIHTFFTNAYELTTLEDGSVALTCILVGP